MSKLTDPRWVKIPLEEAVSPKDGYVVMLDMWWEVVDGCVLGWNPDIRFPPSPQANKNKTVVQALKHKESSVVFLPVVYWKPFF